MEAQMQVLVDLHVQHDIYKQEPHLLTDAADISSIPQRIDEAFQALATSAGSVTNAGYRQIDCETSTISITQKHDEKLPSAKPSQVKVLNLGLFRTGTSSLSVALHLLGFDGIYHMDTIFSKRMEDSKVWIQAFDSKFGAPPRQHFPIDDLRRLFNGFEAVTDLPASAFAEELLQAFPDAKVILTVRDDADVWQAAVERTVWHVHANSFFRFTGYTRVLMDPLLPSLFRMGRRMFLYLFDDDLPRTGRHVYNDHIIKIKSLVPSEKLLVFNVKQGWKPLCDFLGREIPDAKFPHVNDGAAFIAKVKAKQELMKRKMRDELVRIAVTMLAAVVVFMFAKYLY